MSVTWLPINSYFHDIINEPEVGRKLGFYRSHFLQRWQPIMQLMACMFGAAPDDELAVARTWAWPLPQDLARTPDALTALETAGAWGIGEAALQTAVARFSGYDLPFDRVEGWLMLGVSERSNPIGRGYTGAIDYTQPRLMCQYSEPSEQNLHALPGAVAHEFHHLVRLRVFPWDMQRTTVADYIVHEGMAESFATALFGEKVLGFYVTDISQSDLQTAKALIGDGLE